jgi:hypothetical protein
MKLRAAAPWLLMALTVALFALAFWPGHMNNDSLSMIGQASGEYPLNDHHSPLMVWVWELLWPLGLRPGVILVLQLAAFMAGAYLVARAAFGRLGAALVAVGASLWPAVFGNLGVIGRDAWFLAFLLLTFGFCVLAVRSPERRAVALWCALGFGLLTLFARQNAGAAIVVAAVIGLALVLSDRVAPRPWAIRAAALGTAAVGAVALAIGLQLGATKLVGADPAHPEQYVYLYDLAGLSVRDGVSHFPPDVYPSGDVPTLARTSSVDTIIPLSFGEQPPIGMPRPPDQVAEMREAWLDEVTGDPIEYLDWRWDAYMEQIGVRSPGIFVYHPVIDPNPFGYEIALPELNDVATGYQELFADDFLNGGTFHLGWFYLLLALCSAIVLLSIAGAARIVGALALACLTYQVGLFFGTMGTQWRFEFPIAAIAVICAAVAVKAFVDRVHSRDAPAAEDEVSRDSAPEPRAAVPMATGPG